jgi:hypothetical protein
VQIGERSSGRSGRDSYTAETIQQFGFKDDNGLHRIKLNALGVVETGVLRRTIRNGGDMRLMLSGPSH